MRRLGAAPAVQAGRMHDQLERIFASQSWRMLCVSAAIFLLNALRLPGTFLYPSFWAEDGHEFFRQSLELGSQAIFEPIAGMYLTLPRLIAWGATFLPVQWAPAVYAAGAGVVSSCSLALFSRDGFRWLLPSDRARAAACLLFALAPGADESSFALCTVMYALLAGLFFLLLERDASGVWQMGWRRAILVSFLWLTVGHGILLAPLLLYLLVRTRNPRYVLCLAALAVAVWLNSTVPNIHLPSVRPPLTALLQVFADNVLVRLVYIPLLGGRAMNRLFALGEGTFLLLSLPVVAAVVVVLRRLAAVDAEGRRGLALAVLCVMSAFPLTTLTRNYGLVVLRRTPQMDIHQRYALVPAVVALLVVWTALARPVQRRAARIAAYALLAWLSFNTVTLNPVFVAARPLPRFVSDWPQQAATLQSAVDRRRDGTLRRKVVVREIWCRPRGEPFEPDVPPIAKIKITP
jgi:hypothetical protein